MAAKLTKLSHKIAIQLHLVAESCTVCGSRTRRPVLKLLVTSSYNGWLHEIESCLLCTELKVVKIHVVGLQWNKVLRSCSQKAEVVRSVMNLQLETF